MVFKRVFGSIRAASKWLAIPNCLRCGRTKSVGLWKVVALLAIGVSWGACVPDLEGTTLPLPTSICVTVRHHELPLPNTQVFLKYHTDTFPGYYQPLDYYDTLLVTDANGRACVSPVPVGRHWVIVLGVDEHAQAVLPVFGRMPITIDLDRRIKVDTVISVYE